MNPEFESSLAKTLKRNGKAEIGRIVDNKDMYLGSYGKCFINF